MKTGLLIVAGIAAIYIVWKIISFVVWPFLIPIAVIGGGYMAYKKGWFKKLF